MRGSAANKECLAPLRCHWQRTSLYPVAYAENFYGGFTQGHMVVICTWCALFVTSQFDVIFTFPNQRFGEVCWNNRHILLHALPILCVSSKLGYWTKINSALRHSSSQLQKYQAVCWNGGVKHTHHCIRAIYDWKMGLHWCLVEHEQSSIESVRLDSLTHTPVCKIESC